MKPLLLPSSSLFLLSFVVFVSINVPCSLCADDEGFTNCNKTGNCGNISNIKYPFWGLGRENYCGQSEILEVTCESDIPKLTINSVKYRILDWDQENLTVARDDFWETLCPSDYKNSTFDVPTFKYIDGLQNLTLFYQCNDDFVGNNMLPFQPCPGTTTQFRYSAMTPNFSAFGYCSYVIVIPINGSQVQAVMSGQIESAIRSGFGLEWVLDNGECNSCSNSGGECGNYNGGFACFCRDGLHLSSSCSDGEVIKPGKGSNHKVIGISVGVAAFVGILLGCLLCCVLRRRKRITEESKSNELFVPPSSGGGTSCTTSTTNTSKSIPSYSSSDVEPMPKSFYYGVQVFPYAELEEATDNFNSSKELGDGGFGTVYYGKLKDGRVVAVKRLYESNFKRVQQFMNEVQILAKIRHENLVALYGCTSRHSRELLLVYEYIPNGTVADHVHGKKSKSAMLPWSIRLNIAVETAQGLAYLHASDVIHRDVKTTNILLDDDFCVKVADFGLSKLLPNDVTHVSTAPQGTPGYVDPEYYQYYKLTDKSDVYSFGVVLIELISSLEAVDIQRTRLDVNLANMAVCKIQNHKLEELVDTSLGFERDPAIRRMITSVAELAFRCLQQERDMRPPMSEVLAVLKEIQNEWFGQQNAKVVDIREDEVIPLKNVSPPFSPDSVADNWQTDAWKKSVISTCAEPGRVVFSHNSELH